MTGQTKTEETHPGQETGELSWKITARGADGCVMAAELWRDGQCLYQAGSSSDIVKALSDPALLEFLDMRPFKGKSPGAGAARREPA